MQMTLTRDEIKEITRKSWRSKQCESLRALGIPFKTDDQGWPVVSRKAALSCLEAANQDDDEGTVKLDWLNG